MTAMTTTITKVQAMVQTMVPPTMTASTSRPAAALKISYVGIISMQIDIGTEQWGRRGERSLSDNDDDDDDEEAHYATLW